MAVETKLNVPEGDGPENRYDCFDCMHAPMPDEYIVLVTDDAGAVEETYCVDCAKSAGLVK